MAGPSQSRSDQQIVERIRRGNRQALDRLFRSHYEALCRFALGYVDHLRIAEDLVQDIFFDLWKDRHTLDVERTLRAYLYGMTRHRALKHLRREQLRDQWVSNGDLGGAVSRTAPDQAGDLIENQEQKEKVEQALEALPERRREIFLLSRRHDLTYSEIAVALDISINTVKTQMSRALKFLREHLKPLSTS